MKKSPTFNQPAQLITDIKDITNDESSSITFEKQYNSVSPSSISPYNSFSNFSSSKTKYYINYYDIYLFLIK